MISGYINSVPFSVYDCGEIMILDDHYIKWLPSYIHTGTFTIEGSTYNFSDYSSGMFTWSTATITSFAFRSLIFLQLKQMHSIYLGELLPHVDGCKMQIFCIVLKLVLMLLEVVLIYPM